MAGSSLAARRAQARWACPGSGKPLLLGLLARRRPVMRCGRPRKAKDPAVCPSGFCSVKNFKHAQAPPRFRLSARAPQSVWSSGPCTRVDRCGCRRACVGSPVSQKTPAPGGQASSAPALSHFVPALGHPQSPSAPALGQPWPPWVTLHYRLPGTNVGLVAPALVRVGIS